MPEVTRELFIFGGLRIKSLMQWMGTAKLYPLEAGVEQRNRDKNVPGSQVLFVFERSRLRALGRHVARKRYFVSLDLNG
jgi:hypothetical protein